MKATAQAHPNVAFIKYWGRKDEVLRLPTNGSISMNLSKCTTTTSVEFIPALSKDEIAINGQHEFESAERVIKHLDRVRKIANITHHARVFSENNFPSSTGLSSSSSGFAALTLAATKAAGLHLSEKELSILARQGSGSACRSIPDGFVEWLDGSTSEESYATSLFPSDYWDIVDVVAVVSTEKKEVSTSKGQTYASTSPFFEVRRQHMNKKIVLAKQYIKERNFSLFGQLIEAEALEMHAIMLTSTPSLIYWSEGTLHLMKEVKKWRNEGLEVYFTINTGQDIHLFCQSDSVSKVEAKLAYEKQVKNIFVNHPGAGARIISA